MPKTPKKGQKEKKKKKKKKKKRKKTKGKEKTLGKMTLVDLFERTRNLENEKQSSTELFCISSLENLGVTPMAMARMNHLGSETSAATSAFEMHCQTLRMHELE